ncbi:hypothetical protein [Photobacterium sanguinicancri]|uniref:hypothetical protein n=1 Tax=Photobacterium sanguinicancri TaxID=875932 RepID=UPI0021C298EB|nr:hypothetical protein [Photobacterium sanguinicancri]
MASKGQGLTVREGFKIGGIDHRGPETDYTTVSDKARAIACRGQQDLRKTHHN